MHLWMRTMGLLGRLSWEFALATGRANASGAIVKKGKAPLKQVADGGALDR
jgi:hypothetical protein